MNFSTVTDFEIAIAEFFGAPYAVATDCCTHALELCLRYKKIRSSSCPTHTYISVPFTFDKLGIDWDWEDRPWINYYTLGGTNIVDAAAFWQRDGYVAGHFMCLSFQYNKHLALGRGGMILCDDRDDQFALRAMSYDGRVRGMPWAEQAISTMGYHYYMTPETADLGLKLLPSALLRTPTEFTWRRYPYLPDMPVFNQS
jgi:dTDP-4-amino-4,6-dideoxygalactose transaminase